MPPLLSLVLTVLALALALGAVLWDMQRRSVRTVVLQSPGRLRFEAQNFSLELLRQAQQVRVHCVHAHWQPAGSVPTAPAASQPVDHAFAAVGFSVELRACMRPQRGGVQAVATGHYDLVMVGADSSRLTIARVNATVAGSFQAFYRQVRLWIDKLEQRLEQERVERLRAQEDAAQAQQHAELMARLMGQHAAPAGPSEADRDAMAAAQLAHWRSAAGFAGQHSRYQTDATGRITWLVDLAMDGRITLHADQHTVHTSLRGAHIAARSNLLEVSVRDAHWSEAQPDLRVYRILQDASNDERRAWKERLEILRNSLALA